MTHVSRRDFLRVSSGSLAALSLSAVAAPAKRPNFIVLMADDLGAQELGCYGNQTHQTPNLDRMAAGGLKFETFYACPICHPSRFQIMTGQYGHHNGVYNFGSRRGGPTAGDNIAAARTFGHILQDAGYATALAGKWQLSGRLPDLIHEAGFDEYCMWAYQNNLPEGVKHTGGWEGKPGSKTSRYWYPSTMTNGTYRPPKPDDYGPDIFADFAIDFMTRHKDDPFFVYFPMALTHSPYYTTPDNTKGPKDHFKNLRENWRANVEYADKIVGRLLSALERLGLSEDTIVMFTGDNGTGHNGKARPTELGARVPMVVYGKGRVKATGSTLELADLSDVLPTLCDLSGAPVPDDRPIDGTSFAPLLDGRPGKRREWIYSYIADRRILRDKRWLWEDNSPLHRGRFYDCGTSRDGTGYREVTDSEEPEVVAARQRFEGLIKTLPVPVLDYEGPAAEMNSKTAKRLGRSMGKPWDARKANQAKLWVPAFDSPIVSAAPKGVRFAVKKGKVRGVAMAPGRFALPKGATHVRLEVAEVSPGLKWMFKLAGTKTTKAGNRAAHTTTLGKTGVLEIPLSKLVLSQPTETWQVKFGIASGKPGDSVVLSVLEFITK